MLSRDRVVIYEAAFRHENLFVRIDILIKEGNRVELIEVKAKSFNPMEDGFYDRRLRGCYKIVDKWKPHLYDIAFQTFVCSQARRELSFEPFLMLVDKTKVATVDGLNQKFLLLEENGRMRIRIVPGLTSDSIGQQILCKIDVKKPVTLIHEGRDLGKQSRVELGMRTFEEEINFFSENYLKNQKIEPERGAKCKNCEFRTLATPPKKSGFKECWAGEVTQDEIDKPFVFDIWNIRKAKADALIATGKVLMKDVTKEDISPKKIRAQDSRHLSASGFKWSVQERERVNPSSISMAYAVRSWPGSFRYTLLTLKRRW